MQPYHASSSSMGEGTIEGYPATFGTPAILVEPASEIADKLLGFFSAERTSARSLACINIAENRARTSRTT